MLSRRLIGLRRFATSSIRLNSPVIDQTVDQLQQQPLQTEQAVNKTVENTATVATEGEQEVVKQFTKEQTDAASNQLIEILFGKKPSNKLNKELSENKQLKKELLEFFDEFAGSTLIPEKKTVVKNGPNKDYPFLLPSSIEEPYTSQELHLRRQHFSELTSKLGSNLKDVYLPHHDVFYPTAVNDVSIAKLLAAGCHLGHSTSLYRPSNQPYILGSYKGLHIIDLEQTLSNLRRAAKVVEGVAERGGIILYVGTRENLQRPLELAADRSKGYYIASRWVPGTITNCTEISTWARHEVDLEDNSTGRALNPDEKKSLVKPDLVVILNPVENRVAIHECIQARIPTIGIIDTDSEASLFTYPIPGNDDTARSLSMFVGVLSKAGEKGRARRLVKIAQYKKQQEQFDKRLKEKQAGIDARSLENRSKQDKELDQIFQEEISKAPVESASEPVVTKTTEEEPIPDALKVTLEN